MPKKTLVIAASATLLAAGAIALALQQAADTLDPHRKIPPPVPTDGYVKKGPPKEGDWLDRFKEEGQTFGEYSRWCRNLVHEGRRTFYIQPLGDLNEEEKKAVEAMRDYAEIFFGIPAKVLPVRPLFKNAHSAERDQWDATTITAELVKIRPKDAAACVGITGVDLYSEGLNFVFGQASLGSRCGIYSLVRYRTSDKKLFLRRALKLMAHEAGHIFSVYHCVEYECAMNGANHLREDDSHPMHLCPDDLRKLEWNLQFDRIERYRKLRDFYAKRGLKKEAEWVAARLAAAGGENP